MKTFFPFIAISLFLLLFFRPTINLQHINPFSDGERKSEVLVYDGFEGGYLFFTNVDHQAVVLEIADSELLKTVDLINGDFVGKKLKVEYEEMELQEESSSMGRIEEVMVLP